MLCRCCQRQDDDEQANALLAEGVRLLDESLARAREANERHQTEQHNKRNEDRLRRELALQRIEENKQNRRDRAMMKAGGGN